MNQFNYNAVSTCKVPININIIYILYYTIILIWCSVVCAYPEGNKP